MTLDNFPFTTCSTTGDQAEQLLLRMRADLQPQGQIPVIIGDAESASGLVEAWTYGDFSFDAALRAASAEEPEQWFQKQMDEDPEAFGSLLEGRIYPQGVAPMTRLQVGFDYLGKPRREVFIAQLPTPDYWKIPLYLRFGAWNACPTPAEHAMLAKHWEQKYGAKIAVITSDTVEFTVERRPSSREDCAELARQQYIYCPDIVDQGVGSVPTLAEALRGSKAWFFWWD